MRVRVGVDTGFILPLDTVPGPLPPAHVLYSCGKDHVLFVLEKLGNWIFLPNYKRRFYVSSALFLIYKNYLK